VKAARLLVRDGADLNGHDRSGNTLQELAELSGQGAFAQFINETVGARAAAKAARYQRLKDQAVKRRLKPGPG
jgi:hypothetical protein